MLAFRAAATGRPETTAEYGRPDCAVNIGAIVQPPKIARTPALSDLTSGDQTALATNRCGILKSVTPRSRSRLNGSVGVFVALNVTEVCPVSLARERV